MKYLLSNATILAASTSKQPLTSQTACMRVMAGVVESQCNTMT